MNKKDEVNQIVDKQIEENTEDYVPYLIKGNILKEEEKLDEAIENYQKCLKNKKNCHEAYYNLALCQAILGQNEEALKNIEEALKLKSDFSQSLDAKGSILFSEKNFEEALKCYQKLVEKDNSNEDYFFKKGSCERKLKQYDEAKNHLTKL